MRVNVEKVLERDQKISELDKRADDLQEGASQFQQQAVKLKRKYWWENIKVSYIFASIHNRCHAMMGAKDVTDKYARILLFQVVFTKYVFGFCNYDGFNFIVFAVILETVIRRNIDQIRLLYLFHIKLRLNFPMDNWIVELNERLDLKLFHFPWLQMFKIVEYYSV